MCPKILTGPFYHHLPMNPKTAGRVANSIDPDQMLHSAASDLGLHVCKGLSVPLLRVNVVTLKASLLTFDNL